MKRIKRIFTITAITFFAANTLAAGAGNADASSQRDSKDAAVKADNVNRAVNHPEGVSSQKLGQEASPRNVVVGNGPASSKVSDNKTKEQK